jgi:hypothetical protein
LRAIGGPLSSPPRPGTVNRMHYYSAYNLRIQSQIALPELPPAPPGSDLTITLAPPQDLNDARSIEFGDAAGSEAVFSYPGVARFTVRAGRELTITPDLQADESIFGLYVQGMMLAAALHQRGYFVLHASVVCMAGRAVAFMGPTGAGKSTFASALRFRGHRILADDNAAIDLAALPPGVLPAFPNLKIYPDVAASLGYRLSSLRPMHASQVKQAQTVACGFWPTPLPLSCVYLLDREAAPSIPAPLAPVQTITELVRHSAPTRWGVPGNGRHLQMCAQLAKTVPIFAVRTFTRLEEIPQIANVIEEHALRLSPDMAGRALCMAE